MKVRMGQFEKAIYISILLFFGSLALAGYGLLVIQPENTEIYLFGATFLMVLFMTVNIYQILTTRVRANKLVSTMTEDFFSSKQLFQELYRNSPVPYMLIEHNGDITFPNIAAHRLFGVQEGALEKQDIFDLLHAPTDDEGSMHAALLKPRFKQGTYINDEDVLIKRVDGTIRYAKLSIFPYGESGWRKKGLLTLVDVTKLKEVDKAKSEFVSLASHQLHTPISSMKWSMELMVNPRFGTLNEKQVSYLEKIANGLTRMEHIIDDFLNATQLELGNMAVDYSDVDLGALCDDIFEEQSGRIHLKAMSVTRTGTTNFESDPRLLRMSIGNLISNAIKYTPENGAVEVAIQDVGSNVVVTVSDTGIGIPSEDQDKIFTKFFRAENAHESETDGTGLGLYIVQLAVHELDGTIGFISEQNKGTVFTVTLPRR